MKTKNNWKDFEKQMYKRLTFLEKLQWLYWKTPLSLTFWQDRLEDLTLWWVSRKK